MNSIYLCVCVCVYVSCRVTDRDLSQTILPLIKLIQNVSIEKSSSSVSPHCDCPLPTVLKFLTDGMTEKGSKI